MAAEDEDSKASQRFTVHSILDLIIPEASQLDIEEALSSASANTDGDDAPIGLASIPQRKALYFDEQLSVFVVLQTPYQEEDGLKAYIERLSISLEAHALNGLGGEGRDGGPPTVVREVLWSGKVATREDPVIIVEEAEDGEDEDQRDMFIIWKMTALLTRPRIRLQAPGILFKLSGTLGPVQIPEADVSNPYLRSGVPFTSQNIFQALEGDAFLKGAIPYLPASRLSHIPPNNLSSRPSALPLKVVSQRAIRAYVALNARFRYQSPRASSQNVLALASLDLEVPPHLQHALEISSVEADLASGQSTLITPAEVLTIPKRCQPRDNIIFLYQLVPDQLYSDRNSRPISDLVRQVELSITAKILVSPHCSPTVLLRWRTSVDFSPTSTKDKSSSQSLTRNQHNKQSLEPSSASKASVESQRPYLTDLGVSATLAVIDNVRVGEPFHWDIFLVNHSAATRKLSVVIKSQSSNRASIQQQSLRHVHGTDDAAAVHVEEPVLFSLTRNAQLSPAGLICLTTDLNVEQLAPNACTTFSLTFLPLIAGRLDLATIEFVDKESSETLELKDFPDVVVKGRIDEPNGGDRDNER